MQYSFASRTHSLLTSPLRSVQKLAKRDSLISLAEELPAEELFPVSALAEAAGSVLSADPRSLQYGEAEGYGPLRQWLSESWSRRKGLHMEPDRILLTTGTQQAMDLLVRSCTNPEDTVLVENPTSPGLLQVLRLHGVRMIPVRSDHDGVLPEQLAELLLKHQPKLFFAAPNFNNPTGALWSLERRLEVLKVIAGTSLLVVEDDSLGELCFPGSPAAQPLPPLAALEERQGEQVLYVGSFSKTVAPALRTGWAAGPSEVISMMTAVKLMADWQSSMLIHRMLHHLLLSRHFHLEEHLSALNREYVTRLKLMDQLLRRSAWSGASYELPKGGMFLWVRLPGGLSGDVLLKAAALKGVSFLPGSMCSPDGENHDYIRLNFTHPGRDELMLGMNLISEALREFTARS
ncbi:PLP-dependent aminotransferase family protein [Paenibacillus sp. F411]|uniref:Putative GntR family transcriptional regulator n=1 Tax=Paenibacillus algicola TaxID=2565926 RepID=A0A4P8XT11_9BACL|nr:MULTISPECIES: PLP-dependent aminotransferase family protein [Paenibacillus]MBO2943559.1 PLP-dependent aminotransferase family protein [Paenibacillus sp. F411]QCT03839.1 putative GntR family transcriptional regulator [Paenibacillus algicola]